MYKVMKMSELVIEFRQRLDDRAKAHAAGLAPPINFDRGPGSRHWQRQCKMWNPKKKRIRLAKAA